MWRCDSTARHRRARWGAAALLAATVAMGGPPRGNAEALSLADAVRRAAGGTAAVQTAGLRTQEAEARVKQARAGLLPTLSGAAGQIERTFNINTLGISIPSLPGMPKTANPVGPVETFDARLRTTQTLFDAAVLGRMRSARAGVGVSRAEGRVTSQQAAQTAALTYVRAARAAATVVARQADLDIASQLDTLAATQMRAGTAANIDVLRARTQAATARSLLLVARNELQRAQIDLARAMGAEPGARFELADSLSASTASDAPEAYEAAVALARQRRSDLQAEQARLDRARQERGAISAERLPRLEASADLGLSGLRAPDAIQTHQFGVQLSVPLFDGLRREQRIREQVGIVGEAEIRSRDLVQQIAADVQASLLGVASGLEQEAVARERVALAEQELSEARERFTNGVAGNIEIINAQSSLIRARDADIDARAATAVARINLARAVGVAETVR